MDTIDAIDLRTLRLFEAVARLASFSEAGRELGMPRALASKLIADLEDTLGGKLFRRTTRKVGLTDLGETLLAQSAEAALQLRETLLQARSGAAGIAGLIRFSVSHGYGRHVVLPKLSAFRERYPQVRIEVILSDSIDDLVLKTLDFSIRLGPLPDSSMVVRRMEDLDVVLVGAATLLRAASVPRRLEDIASLPLINFRLPGTGALAPWVFNKAGRRAVVDTSSAILTVNSIEVVADLVIAGVGVAPIPRYLVASELKTGRLKALFPAHRFADIPVHICFTDRGLMPGRVRLLIDALTTP
jgi:LysR family transcriptional regulator, regulator for bpeEF and oprC